MYVLSFSPIINLILLKKVLLLYPEADNFKLMTFCRLFSIIFFDGQRLTRVPRLREVWSSNPRPAKSYTALQTVRHRFKSTQVAVLSWRYDAGMGTANSLHASA